MNKGWKNESARHSLAARGMKTRCKTPSKSLILSNYREVIDATPQEWKHQFEKLTEQVKNSYNEAYKQMVKSLMDDEPQARQAYLAGKDAGLAKGREMIAIWLTPSDWSKVNNESYRASVKSLSKELQSEYDLADSEYNKHLYMGAERNEIQTKRADGYRVGIGRTKDLFMHYMEQWSR